MKRARHYWLLIRQSYQDARHAVIHLGFLDLFAHQLVVSGDPAEPENWRYVRQ